MKKILLMAILMSMSVVGYSQTCSSFGTGDICQNFKNNGQQMQYAACCACGTSPQKTNTTGCPAQAPINTGLIFMIIAGIGFGAFALKKREKLVA